MSSSFIVRGTEDSNGRCVPRDVHQVMVLTTPRNERGKTLWLRLLYLTNTGEPVNHFAHTTTLHPPHAERQPHHTASRPMRMFTPTEREPSMI